MVLAVSLSNEVEILDKSVDSNQISVCRSCALVSNYKLFIKQLFSPCLTSCHCLINNKTDVCIVPFSVYSGLESGRIL